MPKRFAKCRAGKRRCCASAAEKPFWRRDEGALKSIKISKFFLSIAILGVRVKRGARGERAPSDQPSKLQLPKKRAETATDKRNRYDNSRQLHPTKENMVAQKTKRDSKEPNSFIYTVKLCFKTAFAHENPKRIDRCFKWPISKEQGCGRDRVT